MLKPNSNDVLFHSFRKQYDGLSPKEMALLEARTEGVTPLSSHETKSETQSESNSTNGSDRPPADASCSVSWKKGLRVLERRQKDRGVFDTSFASSEDSTFRTSSSAAHSQATEGDYTKLSETQDETLNDPTNLFDQLIQNLSHPSEILGISTSNSQGTESGEANDSSEDNGLNLEILQQSARTAPTMGKSFDMIDFNDIKTKTSRLKSTEDSRRNPVDGVGEIPATAETGRDPRYLTAEDLKEKFRDVLCLDIEGEDPRSDGRGKKIGNWVDWVEKDKPQPLVEAPSVEGEMTNKSKKWSKRKAKAVRIITRSKARIIHHAQVPWRRLKATSWKRQKTVKERGDNTLPFHRRMRTTLNGKLSGVSTKRLTRSYRRIANDFNASARTPDLKTRRVNLTSFAKKSIVPLNASLARTARQCRTGASEVISSFRRSRSEKYEDVGESYANEDGPLGSPRSEKRRPGSHTDHHSSTRDLAASQGLEVQDERDAARESSNSPAPALIFADDGEIEAAVHALAISQSSFSEKVRAAPVDCQSRNDGASPTLELLLNPSKSSVEMKTYKSTDSELSKVEGSQKMSTRDSTSLRAAPQEESERNGSDDSEKVAREDQSNENEATESAESWAFVANSTDEDGGRMGKKDVPISITSRVLDPSQQLDLKGASSKLLQAPGITDTGSEARRSHLKIIERFNQSRPEKDTSSRGEESLEAEIEIVRSGTQVDGCPEQLVDAAFGESEGIGDQRELQVLLAAKKSSKGRTSLMGKDGSGLLAGAVNEKGAPSSNESSPVDTVTHTIELETQCTQRASGKVAEGREQLIAIHPPDSASASASLKGMGSHKKAKKTRGRGAPGNSSAAILKLQPATIRISASDNGILPKRIHRGKGYRADRIRSMPDFLPLSQNPITTHNVLGLDRRVSSSIVATNDISVEMVAKTNTINQEDIEPLLQVGVDEAEGEGVSSTEKATHDRDKAKTKKRRSYIKARTINFLKPKRKVNILRNDGEKLDKPSCDAPGSEKEDTPTEKQLEEIETKGEPASKLAGQLPVVGQLPDVAHFGAGEEDSMLSSVIEETLPDLSDTGNDILDLSNLFSKFFGAAAEGDNDVLPGCADSVVSGDTMSLQSSTKSPSKTDRKYRIPFIDDVTAQDDSYEDGDTVLSSPALLNQFLSLNNCNAGCNDGFNAVQSEVSSVTGSSDDGSSAVGGTPDEDYSESHIESKEVSPISSKASNSEADSSNVPSQWIEIPEPHKSAEAAKETNQAVEKKKPRRGVKKRLLSLVRRTKKTEKATMQKDVLKDGDDYPDMELRNGAGKNIHEASFISLSLLSDDDVSSSSKSTSSWINGSDVFSGVTASIGESQK